MRTLLIASVAALVLAGTGAAGTTVERSLFEGSFTNPCTNETFAAHGTILHKIKTDTLDDGSILVVEDFKFIDVEGTTVDGVHYVVPNKNVRRVLTRPDGSSSFSFEASQSFVRDGDSPDYPNGDDLEIHVVSSFDVDAAGNVTNQVFETTLVCG
jgi:hypothetical protein